MESFLTDVEQQALSLSTLHIRTPFLICGVTRSQFSIARYYGGATFNGSQYVYLPDSDELIRDDVLKFVQKLRKKNKAGDE